MVKMLCCVVLFVLYKSGLQTQNTPPLHLKLTTYPKALVVRPGGHVVLQCRDEGPPARAYVQWARQNGMPLKLRYKDDRMGRLELFNVTASDSGFYIFCQAPEFIGRPGSELRVPVIVQDQTEACDPDQFRCDNQHCGRVEWLCDGDDDCGDGSDERC